MTTHSPLLRWLKPFAYGLLFLAEAACLTLSIWGDQLVLPPMEETPLSIRRGMIIGFLGIQLLAGLTVLIELKQKARFPHREDWVWWLEPAFPPGREEWFRVGISGFLWSTGFIVLLGTGVGTESSARLFFSYLAGWGGLALGMIGILSRSGLRLMHRRPLLALKPGTLLIAPDNAPHIVALSEIEQIDLKDDFKIGKLRIKTIRRTIEVDCAPFDQQELSAFYAALKEGAS